MYPEVVIAGNAGAGKSTLADLLMQRHGVPTVEYADEIKRFCYQVFGFTEEQLWGPSEARNANDPRFDASPGGNTLAASDAWEAARTNTVLGSTRLLRTLGFDGEGYTTLLRWFDALHEAARHVGLSPRVALQTLGTWGREQRRNVWVDRAGDVCAQLLEGGCSYFRTEGVVSVPGALAPPFVAICGGRYPNEILGTKRRGGFAVLVEDPEAVSLAGVAGQHSSETSLSGIPRGWYSAIVENPKAGGLEALANEADELVAFIQDRL